MNTIRAFFSPKLGHFFPFSKKGNGKLPLPPLAAPPVTMMHLYFCCCSVQEGAKSKFRLLQNILEIVIGQGHCSKNHKELTGHLQNNISKVMRT